MPAHAPDRIFSALSDPTRTLASPYEVLRRSGDLAADRRAIVATAREVGANVVVSEKAGLPCPGISRVR